jgi:hypothetical protein
MYQSDAGGRPVIAELSKEGMKGMAYGILRIDLFENKIKSLVTTVTDEELTA